MSSAAKATGQRKPAHVCILAILQDQLDGILNIFKDPFRDPGQVFASLERLGRWDSALCILLTLLRTMVVPPNAIAEVIEKLLGLRRHPAIAACLEFRPDDPNFTQLLGMFDNAIEELDELGAQPQETS